MTKRRVHKSAEENKKLFKETEALVKKGSSVLAACSETGLRPGTYYNTKARLNGKGARKTTTTKGAYKKRTSHLTIEAPAETSELVTLGRY